MSTLADQLIPRPDTVTRHAIVINASRERVWDAAVTLKVSDLKLARPLLAARGLASRLRNGHPQLDVATFTALAEVPGRELVHGLVGQWWKLGGAGNVPIRSREAFEAFDRPGYAKGTFSVELQDAGPERIRLVTETRVVATSPDALRDFRRYWMFIRFGSSLLRRVMLAAVKERATAR
ncbi:hypothetical protein ACOZ38_05210 [Sphaerisporangium viridialbum]|uniref:hypothetical protein n=1 Tax=Sphaerisporangium viridialbum TaxID=46189 RepID=UPI003C74BFD8